MLKGIHITGAKNKSLVDSVWLLDDDTHDIQRISGFREKHNYTKLKELGLVDFDLFDLQTEMYSNRLVISDNFDYEDIVYHVKKSDTKRK
ncbi:hypothetical protein [Vibrio phage phiKT1024]|nr:hypothetical protein [Vibrio phage phiKT1024]